MATIKDLARTYVEILRKSDDSVVAITEVVHQIKSLRHTSDNSPITENELNDLISAMNNALLPKYKEGMLKLSEDTEALRKLIKAIERAVKK